MSLPADVYYRVVNIAQSYYILLDRLKEMETSVIYRAPNRDGQPHGSQVSNPTADKAVKISERQEECERKIKAVERALNVLGPRYREFIKLHYFEHRKIEDIDLPMSPQERKDVRIFFLIRLARYLHEI